MTNLEQKIKQAIDKGADVYRKYIEDNSHSPHTYHRPDFIAGANLLKPLLIKALEALEIIDRSATLNGERMASQEHAAKTIAEIKKGLEL